MALTITHPKVNTVANWTQADLDAQIALGNFAAGTTLNDITLAQDWNAAHTVSGSIDPTYQNLTANKALTNADSSIIFTNTGATAQISIDFSTVTATRNFQFIVTDTDGFILNPTGTFYLAGQAITGAVSSTTLGSVIKATVVSPTVIILQSSGAWEYP